MKQSPKNRVILAAAGARKTTQLVEEALAASARRILFTTYTIENLSQIRRYFTDRYGCVPPHITLTTWYTFLLQDGVRPYQRAMSKGARARSIQFGILTEAFKKRFGKGNVEAYYFTGARDVYQDRVADFVCAVDDASQGAVIRRLGQVYDSIFIDEIQDLSGWDLDLLDKLFQSTIAVTAVGDPRQATYSTNKAARNKQFRGSGIATWFRDAKRLPLLSLEQRAECYRCNQAICDFADALFPAMDKSVSLQSADTGHDGIFELSRREVSGYVRARDPVILRWDRRADTMELAALNIGAAKGQTFPRVLIFPTKKMLKYLKTKKLSDAGNLEKFYVAVTRARHSVAFVID